MAPDGPEFDAFDDVVRVGQGGFGTVYRAVDRVLRRPVAIKALSTALDEAAVERFRREAVAMSALSGHPNVVPLFSFGVRPDGRPYLVMPYLTRGSLHERLVHGPLPWTEAVRLGIRLAGALESAHRRGVLHRDIKPSNVLLSDYDEPLLADFGIARLAGGFETTSQQVTASLLYTAPEILDRQRPTRAADVYSLGATLYRLLAGAPAFAAPDAEVLALFLRISRDPVPDLRPLGVPERVCAALERAMAKAPADRQRSAEQFGRDLQEAQRAGGLAVTPMATVDDDAATRETALPAGATTEPVGSTARRRRVRRWSAAAGAAIVATVAIAWLSPWSAPGGAHSSNSAPVPADSAGVSVLHVPAGGVADLRVAGQAGQRILVAVAVPAPPHSPIAVQLLLGGNPLGENTLRDARVELDPLTLAQTATYDLRVGPAAEAVDATVTLSQVPDVTRDAVIGTPVPVRLERPRQRALVSFAGTQGEHVTVQWVWQGANPQYTSLSVVDPDNTELAEWSAPPVQSKPVPLLHSGTYIVLISIDGDATGAGTLTITRS